MTGNSLFLVKKSTKKEAEQIADLAIKARIEEILQGAKHAPRHRRRMFRNAELAVYTCTGMLTMIALVDFAKGFFFSSH
jgi:hypothetical protein